MIQKVSEIVGNGLTVVTILMSMLVVCLWFKSARLTIKKPVLRSEDWFITGVFFGFLGETLDNCYWLVAWTLSYFGAESTEAWMQAGVTVNIVTRQLSGILAAYCHIRSALQYHKQDDKRSNHLLKVCAVAGVIYSTVMVIGHEL